MSASIFDPPLWAAVVSALIDMLADPLVHGALAGLLFTTVRLFVKENL